MHAEVKINISIELAINGQGAASSSNKLKCRSIARGAYNFLRKIPPADYEIKVGARLSTFLKSFKKGRLSAMGEMYKSGFYLFRPVWTLSCQSYMVK